MKAKTSHIVFLLFTIFAFVTNASAMDRVVLNGSDGRGGKKVLTQDMFYKTENGR